MAIYVMKSNDWCKIGISENPDRRGKSISAHNPHSVELMHSRVTFDDKKVERRAHKIATSLGYERHYEWFNCCPDDAVLIINKAEESIFGATTFDIESIPLRISNFKKLELSVDVLDYSYGECESHYAGIFGFSIEDKIAYQITDKINPIDAYLLPQYIIELQVLFFGKVKYDIELDNESYAYFLAEKINERVSKNAMQSIEDKFRKFRQ